MGGGIKASTVPRGLLLTTPEILVRQTQKQSQG